VKVGAFFERDRTFQPDDNNPGEERFWSILRRSGACFCARLQGIDAPETHYLPNDREGIFDGCYGNWIAKHVTRQTSATAISKPSCARRMA